MKTRVIVAAVGVFALVAACSSKQAVQKAIGCTDACCGGNAAMLDCGESQNVSCVASGDPCTALAYGCVNGMFFQRAQSVLPATCPVDGGGDAAGDDVDATSGLFGSEDGSADGAEADAMPDAAPDGATAGDDGAVIDGAPADAGTDALADAQP